MIVVHPDGVYFGLPAQEYLDDPALGSGDHKQLLANPVRWWWNSPHATELRAAITTEEEREKTTVAKSFGSAVHTVVLEGQEKFDSLYWTKPDQPEGLLVTREQIREAIYDRTGRKILGSLPLLDHVLEARRAGVGLLEEDWLAELAMERLGRTEISKRWAMVMSLIARMIDLPRPDYEGKSQRQYVLSGGMPEVSVFWTDENGVRLKARFDYLRIKSILDLKTFSARDDEEVVGAFVRSVEQFAYDLQAAHYLEMRAKLAALIEAGAVYVVSGPEPSPTWLRRVAEHRGDPAWVWLTVQTIGMPETDVMEFPSGMIQASANHQLIQARARYVEYRDRFGLDKPWVTTRGTIQLTDEVFEAHGRMRRMQDRGMEKHEL